LIGETIGHYQIELELGRGGMGVVYKARDLRLGRPVAIKFLSEQPDADADAARRLLREAQVSSSLNHPNVCAVYDIGEHRGRPYLVMEYISGRTLKDYIGRKPLANEAIFEFSIQLADALQAAHSAGIIHRDIKSHNIMINERGCPKILDFGLAKFDLTFGASPDSSTVAYIESVSAEPYGSLVGTICYMSPEQARGERIDHRSDLFSLGIVIYEMATGRPPFRGQTLAAVIDSLLNERPKPARALNPQLPASLEPIIAKALEKDRVQRYASADALKRDLQQAYDLYRAGHDTVATGGSATAVHSLAVLPLENLSSDPEAEYFCDGLAEDILSSLSSIDGLRVLSRQSSFIFKGSRLDVREIGERLRVDNVLEGSVRKAGERVRVTVRLVDTADGTQLWSERYDRTLDDVFQVQAEIASQVAARLKGTLAAPSQAAPPAPSPIGGKAYESYLRARFLWNRRDEQGLRKAAALLEEVLTTNPHYALAHAALADAYTSLAFYGYESPERAMPAAERAARRAIELSPELVDAYTAYGCVLGCYRYDWTAAESQFLRALELSPHNAAVHHWYGGWLLAPLGRLGQAERHCRLARELEPLVPAFTVGHGGVLYQQRRWPEAAAAFRNALELAPEFPIANYLLALTLAFAGSIDEANEAAAATPEQKTRLEAQAAVAAIAGKRDESLATLTRLEQICGAQHPTYCYAAAKTLATLGEHERSLKLLQHAYSSRLPSLIYMAVEPLLAPLYHKPAFRQLVECMNLTPAAT